MAGATPTQYDTGQWDGRQFTNGGDANNNTVTGHRHGHRNFNNGMAAAATPPMRGIGSTLLAADSLTGTGNNDSWHRGNGGSFISLLPPPVARRYQRQ